MGDQQGDLKRTLSGFASAAIVLGAISPMAFADTSSSGLTPAHQVPIVVNGQILSNPYEMVGMDSGNQTAFFPIYYFDQALAKIGITATWNGATHVWALTDSNISNPSSVQVAGGVGSGNTKVTLNGTLIKEFNTQVAKDPAGGPVTTYMPAYYVGNILKALGISNSFDPNVGLEITTGQNLSGSLSAIQLSGEAQGNGSVSSPAISYGKAVTLSTTLTDSNGNPIGNAAVTFTFSQYGLGVQYLPSVTNASGATVAPTYTSDGTASYTVYTNSSGQASITVTGPQSTYLYQVTASAAIGNNGQAVSSQPVYLEYVQSNQAGISPSGNYAAAVGTAVPVVVTLPPNANGQPQANVPVTFQITGASKYFNAYFTNSSGANLGTTVTTSTNSSGVAVVWVNDAAAESIEVTATINGAVGLNSNQLSTTIDFGQAGVPATVRNLYYNTSAPAGTNVTVSGTLYDASGNPVPNGQVLVVGSSSSGDFGYVTTSNGKASTTDFPNVGNVGSNITAGEPATSALGELVTADASGNISFQVTDTQVENATFALYPVVAGQVQSSTPLNDEVYSISFTQPTTLSSISLGITDGNADTSTTTNLTGVSASDNSQVTIYADPQTVQGSNHPVTGQTLSYTVSVNSGSILYITDYNGDLYPVNGSTGLTTVAVTSQYNGNGTYTLLVNGQATPLTSTSPDFGVVVTNSSVGNTTLTVSSGNVSSTATIGFTANGANQVSSVSPVLSNLAPGASETLTFQVVDASGNPVGANTQVVLVPDKWNANDPLWITAVNGTALQETETNGNVSAVVPTPIPLGANNATAASAGYTSVGLSNVASWQKGGNITIYTNAQGQFTLTLANGASYFAGFQNGSAQITTAPGATSATPEALYSFSENSKSNDTTDFGELVFAPYGTKSFGSVPSGMNGPSSTPEATIYLGTQVTPSQGTLTYSPSQVTDTVGGTLTLTNAPGISGGTYSITYSGGTLPSSVSINQSNGTVTVAPAAAGSDDGTYTVTYTYDGVTEAQGTFTIVKAPTLNVSNVSVSPTSVTAGSTATISGVLTETSNGNTSAVANKSVTVTLTDSNGTTVTASTTTTSTGQFQVTTPALLQAGTYTVTVSVPSDGSSATLSSSNVTVNPGAVNTVSLGTFSTSSSTSPYDYSGTVTVTDAYGNPITGLTYSDFTVSDNSGNGTTYTGVSSNPAAGDFTVSGGTDGVYTLSVYTSSDVKGDTLTVKVTQGSTSVTATTTYSN